MLSVSLRSRETVDGLDRAAHRAFLRATGLSDAQIEQPFIGVVTTQSETVPCTMGLMAAARCRAGWMAATSVRSMCTRASAR